MHFLYKKHKKTVGTTEERNVLKEVLSSENDIMKMIYLQKMKVLMRVEYMLLLLRYYLLFWSEHNLTFFN